MGLLSHKYKTNDNTKIFHTNVVGVTFLNPDHISRQKLLDSFKSGDKVTFNETTFEGDTCVEVLNKKGQKIGNIQKEFKDEVLKLMHHNQIKKIVSEKVGEDKDILGCSLTIYYE